MTVAELIEKLSAMPQDVEVRLADWNEAYRSPGVFDEVEYVEARDREMIDGAWSREKHDALPIERYVMLGAGNVENLATPLSSFKWRPA